MTLVNFLIWFGGACNGALLMNWFWMWRNDKTFNKLKKQIRKNNCYHPPQPKQTPIRPDPTPRNF